MATLRFKALETLSSRKPGNGKAGKKISLLIIMECWFLTVLK